MTEKMVRGARALLVQLGFIPSENDIGVLRFCATLALGDGTRYCAAPPGEDAMDVLIRMTLGEFFFYLKGCGRAFSVSQEDTTGVLKQIKEGDITLAYDTENGSISSSALIGALRGSIHALCAYRRLRW